MKVELIDHMGSDLDVVNAARVSFDKHSTELNDKDTKLIRYLATHGHWSPFTHVVAKFRVKAPIFVARQLAKHQVGLSWNEVSRRYVDSEPEFYVPDVWRKRADNVKQGSADEPVESNEGLKGTYDIFMETWLDMYRELLFDGVCPEQARIVLPQSTYTEWIWTGSLYAWARVFNQRTDSHAQRESAVVATAIGDSCQTLWPVSWEALTK